jgi:hypothetical protein
MIIHMEATKIQVPINKHVLLKSRKRAEALGFNSINEVVRIFLTRFGENELTLSFIDHEYERKQAAYIAKLDRDFEETLHDIKAGKLKGYTNAEDLVNAMDEEVQKI